MVTTLATGAGTGAVDAAEYFGFAGATVVIICGFCGTADTEGLAQF